MKNARVIHAAISDRVGELQMSLDFNSQANNVQTTIRTTRVPALTVDDLAREHGAPDVLFIDVEGHECHALRGARVTLSQRPACFVEVHAGCGLEWAGGTVGEIFEHLPAAHYQYFAWTETEQRVASITGTSDCPEGRFFLVAVGRDD